MLVYKIFRDGAGEKNRTPDLRITNALLYQLSYAGSDKERRIISAPKLHGNADKHTPPTSSVIPD
jgi:hypothetical protein